MKKQFILSAVPFNLYKTGNIPNLNVNNLNFTRLMKYILLYKKLLLLYMSRDQLTLTITLLRLLFILTIYPLKSNYCNDKLILIIKFEKK